MPHVDSSYADVKSVSFRKTSHKDYTVLEILFGDNTESLIHLHARHGNKVNVFMNDENRGVVSYGKTTSIT